MAKRRISVYGVVFASAICASPTVLTRWWPSLNATELAFWYWLITHLVFAAVVIFAAAAAVFGVAARNRWSTWSQNARHGAALAGVSVATVVAVFFIAHFIHRSLPTGSHAGHFDDRAWRTSPMHVDGDITPRQKMLGEVVDRVLPGKTRKEIEAALGPSEDTAYFEERSRDMIYMTGPERDALFSIDSEWLLIWLDEAGRFERYEIVRD